MDRRLQRTALAIPFAGISKFTMYLQGLMVITMCIVHLTITTSGSGLDIYSPLPAPMREPCYKNSGNPNGTSPRCEDCRRPTQCKDVKPVPDTALDGVSRSPDYLVLATRTPGTERIDNVCNTYFPIAINYTYISFTSTVFVDGTHSISTVLIGNAPYQSGVFRYTGIETEVGAQSRISRDTTFDDAVRICPQLRHLIYRCYLYGSCEQVNPPVDERVILAQVPGNEIPDICFQNVLPLLSPPGVNFRGNDFVRLPFQRDLKCVTRFNGAPCVNAFKIAPKDSFNLP